MYIAKDREASRSWTFDFAPQLAVGETVVSGTVTVLSGTTDVSTTVVGTVTVAPPGGLTFQLRNAYANAEQAPGIYDLFLDATTSTGRRLTEDGQVVITGDTVLHNPPVGSVTLSPASPSIVVGGSQQMTASATDPKGGAVTGLPTTWASSNTAIATVDANGKVAALTSGTATISATIGGVTQSVTLTVTLHTTQLVAQETVVALIVGHVRNGAYTPKDGSGNVTTDPVTYSSSNAAVATVDANGQITPVAAGGPVTITATCGSVTQTRTLTCYADLVPTLAWEPLKDQWPRVCAASISDGNGFAPSEPIYIAAGYYAGVTCREYPVSPDVWGVAGITGGAPQAGTDPGGQAAKGPTASYVMNTDTLPFNGGGHSMHITFGATTDYFQWGWPLPNNASAADPRAKLRRTGAILVLKAHSQADVGKTLDLGSATSNLGQWMSRKTITLASATDFQVVPVDFRSENEEAAGSTFLTLAPGSSGAAALTCDLVWQQSAGGIGEDQNAPWIGFAPTQWGLPCEMVGWNTWGPDSDHPPLYNGTTSDASTDLAPDSASYYDGSPFTDYWMPPGGGVVSPGLCDLRNISTLNTSGAVWIGCYVKPGPFGTMPNDGDLQATLVIAGNAHTYGPVNLVRDPVALRRSSDGASFYRARVPINLASEGYTSGTAYIKNSTSSVLATTMTRCFCVPEDVRCVGWHQALVPRRNLRVQAPPAAPALIASTTGGTLPAGTHYYKVTALDAAGESLASAEASVTTTGTTSSVALTWPAVTGAAGYRVYRGTTAGGENVYYAPGNVTSYTDTNAASTAGSPPTIAPAVVQELAQLRINDVSALLSVDHGFTAMRIVLPYAVGDVVNLGMSGMPGFWQTGPQGSADYNFDWSVDQNQATPVLTVTMNRQVAGYDAWSASAPVPNGSANMPAFQAFDLICAWQNRQLVAFGVGIGVGDYRVTWLPNGSTFLGNTVTWSQSAGSVWEFDQTTYLWGLGGDRDRTRMCGGWIQGIVAGKTVPSTAAELQVVIEEYIRNYWGNRPSY